MLVVYDENLTPIVGQIRTSCDGHLGGSQIKKIYVRNDNPLHYYTSVTIAPQMYDLGDWGEFGLTGWGVKLLAGDRQPSEAEWNTVHSSDTLQLVDIGEPGVADTSYYPVWIKVSVPGGTPAQIRENVRLRVSAIERLV